jgi:HEAT repeat protein
VLPRDQVLSAIEVAKLDDSKQEHGLTGAQKCRALDAIEALASMDPPTRIRAYRVIQDYFPGCRPFVHGALRHREARVRKLAVKVLGENGEARHDLAPATTLLRDPEGTVRLAAVMAIRELGPDTALEPTLAHIRWEPEINIRRMSIKNLRRWKDSRAVPTLKQLLRSEEDRNVRVSIARALDAITGLGLGESPRAWLQHLDREDDDS